MCIAAGRRQVRLLPRILAIVMVLWCMSGCQKVDHSGHHEPAQTVDRDLYCLLGSLSVEECFIEQGEVFVVNKPLAVSEEEIRSLAHKLSKDERKPDLDAKVLLPKLAADSFQWDATCGFANVIEDLWDGADDSGLFPRTKVRSLRMQISTPVLIGDGKAFVVADCTDCQTYYVTKVVVFEYQEGWRVRSSFDIGFV